MVDFSILIGGKAGEGIDKAGMVIASMLNQLGFRIYVYRDYPSLIRGGHTFSIIRASDKKISSHQNTVDFILALNQDTINFHKTRLKDGAVVIYDSTVIKSDGIGVAIGQIVNEEKASVIMRNSCILGCFCRAAGIEWDILDRVFRKNFSNELDLNLKIARRGYDSVDGAKKKIEGLSRPGSPLFIGNELVGLGFLQAGLDSYVSYPMTPSSGILHFLANVADDFGLKVIHPESEIGVILMAAGFAYAGQRVGVGTSGGGFCLMTEGFSFAGMAELPIAVVVGQRPGPSTGLPTYTSQTELNFVLNAGQGEFARFVVAPGDAQEAYYWSAVALNMAWKYQLPSIVLTDKTLAEGVYSFDISSVGGIKEETSPVWDRKTSYQRYKNSDTGVSELAFVPEKDAIIKVNSYEHDESGISTEDSKITKVMQEKRLRKEQYLAKELEGFETIKVYGNKDSSTALLSWGSNKGVCVEVAERLGIKVIHVAVVWPFDVKKFQNFLQGIKSLICVENNATGQFANFISRYGIKTDKNILRYDGRPFSVDELEAELRKVL